jgi:hypothetical protein
MLMKVKNKSKNAVENVWGPWSSYGSCSAGCGQGSQLRYFQAFLTHMHPVLLEQSIHLKGH